VLATIVARLLIISTIALDSGTFSKHKRGAEERRKYQDTVWQYRV